MTGEDAPSIEVDKITEILIYGTWHTVRRSSLVMVPFDLDAEHSVPGIGFRTGPTGSTHNQETIYAPLSSVTAIKTLDDTRTQQPGT
jgi:hypothetical protein